MNLMNFPPRFNVAEIGAMSRDIPYMAKVLVKRVKSDPKVDVKRHWKLITLLIGANDFCSDICYYDPPEAVPKLHEKHLLAALRTIRDNLPRTMVNVVTAPGKYFTLSIYFNFFVIMFLIISPLSNQPHFNTL